MLFVIVLLFELKNLIPLELLFAECAVTVLELDWDRNTIPTPELSLAVLPVNVLLLELEVKAIPCPELLSQVLLVRTLVLEEVSQIPVVAFPVT